MQEFYSYKPANIPPAKRHLLAGIKVDASLYTEIQYIMDEQWVCLGGGCFWVQQPLVPLLLLGPPFLPIIIFVSTTLI
jgi:hypothetical protein